MVWRHQTPNLIKIRSISQVHGQMQCLSRRGLGGGGGRKPVQITGTRRSEKGPGVRLLCILSFVDHASRYICVIKINLMLHYLFSVYLVNQTLHVSGISVAHHQEVYTIYIQQLVRAVLFSLLSTKEHNKYQLYSIYTVYFLSTVVKVLCHKSEGRWFYPS